MNKLEIQFAYKDKKLNKSRRKIDNMTTKKRGKKAKI